MKKFFLTVSLIFHPIIVPLLIVILYFLLHYTFFSPFEYYTILAQVAIVTFFIPISIYYVLRSLGLLKSSIMVSDTKERIIPYVINIFLLLTLNKLVFYNNSAYELNIFFYGLILSYICLLLGSFYYNITCLSKNAFIHFTNYFYLKHWYYCNSKTVFKSSYFSTNNYRWLDWRLTTNFYVVLVHQQL